MNDPDVRRSTHAFATLDGLRDHEGHPWTIAAACSTRLLETASRLSPTAVIGPSFLSEAAARQHAGSVASTVGALVGKRGEWWESCVIDTDGALRWFDRRPDDTTMDMAVQAREIVLDLRAATTATIESVLLYGDDLVKDDVDSCVAGIGPLVQTVARFNPFRVVGADTDDETKRRCIRLAHMLGPIVGHVRSPLQISFPCASLAAR
jgi:hypothetical protein